MALVEYPSCSYQRSIHGPQRTSPATLDAPAQAWGPRREAPYAHLDHIGLASELDRLHINSVDAITIQDMRTSGIAGQGYRARHSSSAPPSPQSLVWRHAQVESRPAGGIRLEHDSRRHFHKWIKSLHRKTVHRPDPSRKERMVHSSSAAAPGEVQSVARCRLRHGHCSSGSSFRFVSAVWSASASFASSSAVTRSERNSSQSYGPSRTNRSSRASVSGHRTSEDSTGLNRRVILEPAAVHRSFQRWRILEELISTEEAYISDVRFFMNVSFSNSPSRPWYLLWRQVYVTILATMPPLSMGLRSSINRNLTEIIELHEEILGDLHRVTPHLEYTQSDVPELSPGMPSDSTSSSPRHRRCASLDAVPKSMIRFSFLHDIPGMVSDPQTAAEVSKIFAKKVILRFAETH